MGNKELEHYKKLALSCCGGNDDELKDHCADCPDQRSIKNYDSLQAKCSRLERALREISEGRGFVKGEEPWEVLHARQTLGEAE